MRSEIDISLEIILNVLKCLTLSLSSQILTLAAVPFLFISVSILYEFAMLPDVYILLSSQEEKAHSSGIALIKKIEPFVCHYINMPSQGIIQKRYGHINFWQREKWLQLGGEGGVVVSPQEIQGDDLVKV